MKASSLFAIVLLVVGCAGVAIAGGPDQGFFFGGGGQLLLMDGTGDWGDDEFEVDADAPEDPDDPITLFWDNKMLFGIKPLVGYKINPQFAVQGSYNYFFAKSSEYSDSETDEFGTYSYTEEFEYTMRSLEIVGIFYPSPDQNFFLYGGIDKVSINLEYTDSYEIDYDGYYDSDSESDDDDITATGLIFGAGVESASEGSNMATFFSAQYSTAKTDDKMFDSDDKLELGVGGFSAVLGIKWYMPTN